MKYIQKGAEPSSFTNWKNKVPKGHKLTFDDLQNPEKSDVREALIQEQGSICCYCGSRIKDENDSHIEHLKPRATFPGHQLEFTNLLTSCEGQAREPSPRELHCGHRKGEWYDGKLLVSPVDSSCESHFIFTSAGEILPSTEKKKIKAAKETISHLGLSLSKLDNERKAAIDGAIHNLQELEDVDIRKIIAFCNTRDSEGHFPPYCFVISYVLNKYL